MKKYIFLTFLALLYSTISPFLAINLVEEKAQKEETLSDDTEESEENYSSIHEESEDVLDFVSENTSEIHYKINELELLVSQEMENFSSLQYSVECKKALAVAIRTKLCYENQFDNTFFNNINKQISVPDEVKETAGIIMTQNEVPINALFHKSSYKNTVTSPSGEKYLFSVTTNEEAQKSEFVFSKDEFKNIIIKICPTAIFEEAPIIREVVYNQENRCTSIRLENCTISSDTFIKEFNLPSTAFELVEEGEEIKIISLGEGNGLGMSLDGADLMTHQGKSFYEILSHYYTDINFHQLSIEFN